MNHDNDPNDVLLIIHYEPFGSNWSSNETFALIRAKCNEHEKLESRGIYQKSKGALERLQAIEDELYEQGYFWNTKQTTYKWDKLMGNYKKVKDCWRRLPYGRNGYWRMDSKEMKVNDLLEHFDEATYRAIDVWRGSIRSIDLGDTILESGNNLRRTSRGLSWRSTNFYSIRCHVL